MTLYLSTAQPLLGVKTFPRMPVSLSYEAGGGRARSSISVPMEEFVAAMQYVLTNTNLEGEDDPRSAFIAWVKQLQPVTGWGGSGTRLHVPPQPE